MVGSSKRSPSPLASRSNLNLPKSLQPHQNQSTTKTFNGPSLLTKSSPRKFNFLTPSNSPSEFGPRNWVGGEEKENEKEKGQIMKLKSPSNGSKNFMAPTISAASKFTPSPRKKILVERNDPVRTSITLSDGKATFFSSLASDFDRKNDFWNEEKSTEGVVSSAMASSQQIKAVPEVPIVPKPLRKVTFKEVTFSPHNLAESSIEKVSINSDLEHDPDQSSVELSNINISCPRIDVVKTNFDGSDFGGSKQLEDSCMCELSENLSFLEGLDQPETGDSWEGLEDVSSIEPVVSESLPLSTPIGELFPEVSSVPKQKVKPSPLRNWKSVCFFLVLLGTFMLSATDFPTMHSLVPKDLKFELSEWSEVAEVAKVKCDEFSGKVKQWSANSISYLYKKVLPVLEMDKMGPLQFMNMTILEDGYQINGFYDVNSEVKWFEEIMGLELEEVEEEEGEDEMEEEGEDEMEEEVNDTMEEDELDIEELEDEMEEVEDEMKEAEESYNSFETTVHMVSAPEAPDTELKMDTSEDNHSSAETDKVHEDNETGSSVASMKLGNQERVADMVSIPESLDITHLKLHVSEIDYASSADETEILLQETQPSTLVESKNMVANQESFIDLGSMDDSSQIPKRPESSFEEPRIKAEKLILGTSFLLFGLGTVAVMIYLKQLSQKASNCVDASPVFHNKTNFMKQEEPSKEDESGESCSSEMSSSQRCSSSYQKKMNTKRESLVYSSQYSFGSPSYGSFTTYETIPVKHGDGDEEIMTPVRRSSRIKKQVTAQ